MNYNKIKELARAKGISIKKLCQEIGISEQGFNAAIKNNTLKIRDLENISEILEVDVSAFFSNTDNNQYLQTKLEFLSQDNEYLKELVWNVLKDTIQATEKEVWVMIVRIFLQLEFKGFDNYRKLLTEVVSEKARRNHDVTFFLELRAAKLRIDNWIDEHPDFKHLEEMDKFNEWHLSSLKEPFEYSDDNFPQILKMLPEKIVQAYKERFKAVWEHRRSQFTSVLGTSNVEYFFDKQLEIACKSEFIKTRGWTDKEWNKRLKMIKKGLIVSFA